MAPYKFAESDCDVICKTALERFRKKRSAWIGWLDCDPVHAIVKQLHDMTWHDVTYRTFNEARRLADGRPTAALAPLLAEFIDVGYVSTQVLAISRLTERNPRKPKHAVLSLKRLVDDISAERALITRENYVSHDGLTYDYEPVRSKHLATLKSGVRFRPTTGWDAWEMSERMHAEFDRLSSVTPAHRSRNDQIHADVFARLCGALEQPVFKEIRVLRHKIIAHAADPATRPEFVSDITLGKIADAHKALMQVTQVVSSLVLCGGGVGTFPHPQFDQLQHLDAQFVPTNHIDQLRAFWNSQEAERDNWILVADKALLPI